MIPEFAGGVLKPGFPAPAPFDCLSRARENKSPLPAALMREGGWSRLGSPATQGLRENGMTDQVQLSPAADDFFRTLDGSIYPQALVDSYPRIANAIVELRDDREKLKNYFDTLLNDTRGGRQGFSFGVLMDIQNLRDAMIGPEAGPGSDDVIKWVS
jgi:hypothetical protein